MMIAIAVSFVRYQYTRHRFSHLLNEAQALVTSMKQRPPHHVDPQGWNYLVDSLYVAVQNACFTPDDTPLDSFESFNNGLKQQLRQTPDLDLAFTRRVLQEMGEISPAAKRHVRKALVLFDDDMASLAVPAWRLDCQSLPQDASLEDYLQGPNYRVLTQISNDGLHVAISYDFAFDTMSHLLCRMKGTEECERFPWHLYFEDVLGEEPVSNASLDDWPARKQAWCAYFESRRVVRE